MYTALAWRNKAFGSGLEFVWSADSNDYAIRETNSRIKIYKNFQVGAFMLHAAVHSYVP